MVKDDITPLLANKAAPEDADEASSRVAKFGDFSLLGLVGCKFRHLKQFREAMAENGWNVDVRTDMKGARNTYRATALSGGGTKYQFILNEWSEDLLEVCNARLLDVGDDADLEGLATAKDTLED